MTISTACLIQSCLVQWLPWYVNGLGWKNDKILTCMSLCLAIPFFLPSLSRFVWLTDWWLLKSSKWGHRINHQLTTCGVYYSGHGMQQNVQLGLDAFCCRAAFSILLCPLPSSKYFNDQSLTIILRSETDICFSCYGLLLRPDILSIWRFLY